MTEKASGKIIAVSRSDKKGMKKTNIPCGMLREEYGLETDAHADSAWQRWVSKSDRVISRRI
jgi:hypothetical protein